MMEDSSKSVYEQRFDAAVKVIQNLPSNGSFQPSNEMMLKFYSYYKQATQGPCSIPRPGFWDPVGKVKWDAWHALGEMPKEEAMTAYVEDLKLIIESMPMTEEVEQLLQVLGPFYELVDEKKKINQVSDLTAGFDSMVLAPPKSVTKSIIRTMQMNGTLDVRAPEAIEHPKIIAMEIKERQHGGDGDGGDDTGSDDENEEEDEQVKKVAALKKKSSTGKAKGVSNGAVGDGVNPVTNGTQISESVNGNHDDEEIDIIPNGSNHTPYEGEDLRGALHVASDSDSEVYCDSVDQFGAEENSESGARVILEDSSREEPPSSEGDAEILLGTQEGIQYGGEDGNTSGGGAQRHGPSTHRAGGSQIRRGRGSRSVGSGSGFSESLQGGGGDEERQGSDEARGGDLNEQIVTALARLQDDMQSVLERLHTLEALTASQARSVALSAEYLHPPANKKRKKPFWWPFDVSPGTVAFAIVWPFIAQWLIRLYFQRRRRKLH